MFEIIKVINKDESMVFPDQLPYGEEICACTVSSLYSLYRYDPQIALFWEICDNNGMTVAYISLFNASVQIVKISEDFSQYEETAEFLELVCGGASIEGSAETIKNISVYLRSDFTLSTHEVSTIALPIFPSPIDEMVTKEIKLNDMYLMLCGCFKGFGSRGERGVWMTDVSARMRKLGGVMYGIYSNGTLVSGCGIYSSYKRFSLISAVGSLPGFRSKGYAGAVVRHAAFDVFWSGGIPLICSYDEHTAGFYKSLGFECFSEYSILKPSEPTQKQGR